MTRLVALSLLFVSLAACSHGGAPDSPDIDEVTPPTVTMTASGFRVDPAPDAPCRPVRVVGCALDGSGDDSVVVTCEDGSSVVVSGDKRQRKAGRVLLCTDVDGNVFDDLVILSDGRLQAGGYEVATVPPDVQATAIEHGSPDHGIILWGQETHPQGWSRSEGKLTTLSWAAGPCVGDGLKAACATAADPRVWKIVGPAWDEGEVVARGVDFVPRVLLDVDLDGNLDLAGTARDGLAWAGLRDRGTWAADGAGLIGLGSGVLVAPTVTGGWGLHTRTADPLPGWGEPLGEQPIGTVIRVREAPRALVMDPATSRAWTISSQPRTMS